MHVYTGCKQTTSLVKFRGVPGKETLPNLEIFSFLAMIRATTMARHRLVCGAGREGSWGPCKY